MRSTAPAAASGESASARIRTAPDTAQARTVATSSPIHSARVSAPSRATITPSRPGPGSLYGPTGTTSSSTTSALVPATPASL